MVKCNICGKEYQSLSSHVAAKHKLLKYEYMELYPNAEWVTTELSKKFSARSKQMHESLKSENFESYMETRRNTCQKMRNNKGVNWTHSDDTKKKMSESHTGKIGIIHSDETKEKISQKKRGAKLNLSPEVKEQKRLRQKESWTQRKNQPEYAEYIQKLSQRRKEYLSTHTIQTKKFGTNIEIEFENFLNSHNIDFEMQYLLDGKSYDFIIPSMKLLVETDGEYWHRLPIAMKNDLEKHEIADQNGLELVRISSDNFISEIIFEDSEARQAHTKAILISRGHEI